MLCLAAGTNAGSSMTRTIHSILAALVAAAAFVMIAGCEAAPARSSRLSAADILETADSIRQSLAESPFLAARTPQSPPIRMGLSEAVNKSADRLAASDRWALTALVVYDRPVQQLFEQTGVHLYMPQDTQQTLQQMGLDPSGKLGGVAIDREAPSHVLRAEIRSIARQGSAVANSISDERYDVYVIEYRITEFNTSTVVWAKTVQMARKAGGTVAD